MLLRRESDPFNAIFLCDSIVGRPVPCDVYKRLADLEQKVLQLEGLSPEYFKQSVSC